MVVFSQYVLEFIVFCQECQHKFLSLQSLRLKYTVTTLDLDVSNYYYILNVLPI